MGNFFKLKLREFGKSYEKLNRKRQLAVLLAIFIMSTLIFSQLMLFKSMDKLKEHRDEFASLNNKQLTQTKEKSEIILMQAYKSEKNLLKTKKDLTDEISKLLKSNDSKKYNDPVQLQATLKKVIEETNGLKVTSLKNIPSVVKTEDIDSVLTKHSFELIVDGDFQSIYDLLNNIELFDDIHVSVIEISKVESSSISSKMNFYVLNINKHIFSF